MMCVMTCWYWWCINIYLYRGIIVPFLLLLPDMIRYGKYKYCCNLIFACVLDGVYELTRYIQHSWKEFLGVWVYKHFGGDSWTRSVCESKHRPLGAGWHDEVKYTCASIALAIICCTSWYDMIYRFILIQSTVGAFGRGDVFVFEPMKIIAQQRTAKAKPSTMRCCARVVIV